MLLPLNSLAIKRTILSQRAERVGWLSKTSAGTRSTSFCRFLFWLWGTSAARGPGNEVPPEKQKAASKGGFLQQEYFERRIRI
jgi:hypothetical protein